MTEPLPGRVSLWGGEGWLHQLGTAILGVEQLLHNKYKQS